MRRFNSFAPALLVLVLTMSVIVFAPRLMSGIQRTRTLATIRMAQAKLDQPSGILEQLNEAYESIAEATLPGVVHIEAKTSMREFVNNRRTGDAMPAPGSTGSVAEAGTAGASASRASASKTGPAPFRGASRAIAVRTGPDEILSDRKLTISSP